MKPIKFHALMMVKTQALINYKVMPSNTKEEAIFSSPAHEHAIATYKPKSRYHIVEESSPKSLRRDRNMVLPDLKMRSLSKSLDYTNVVYKRPQDILKKSQLQERSIGPVNYRIHTRMRGGSVGCASEQDGPEVVGLKIE